MTDLPPLRIVEPSSERGSHRAAGVFVRKEKPPDPAALKACLAEVRERARSDHEALRAELGRTLAKFPGVQTVTATDAGEAIARISEVAGTTRLASINKSNVVINELRPGLCQAGFRTYLRYYTEFQNFEEGRFQKRLQDYWALPGMHDRNLLESFDVRHRIDHLLPSGRRDYVAILGVNAISAEDGSIFFLQHMSNIAKDLQQAKTIILVVAVDKILKDEADALFHAQAMGTFGLETVLLDLMPDEAEKYDFDSVEPAPATEGPLVHVILFDGGRSDLLRGDFRDLFLCIDCRACARQCPVGQHLLFERDMVFSPKNYLFAFLEGLAPSVEACLHCGRCQVECPVGIDLPTLLWRSQIEHYRRHPRGWKKRLLDDPELLAKVGGLAAPLSTWVTRQPAARACIQLLAGIHRKANLPAFQRRTFRAWLKGRAP
ncbi:MAG: lactate utilization protein [Deltaproteobacteria bacterium]|nr:lactate utilization protein [Deltaproteobacteria bacterium]